MNRSRKTTILLFATTLAVCVLDHPSANAGNTWGWKKPMNQRMGAFYTTNRRSKRSSSSYHSFSRYRHSSSYSHYSATPTYAHRSGTVVIVKPAQQKVIETPAHPVVAATDVSGKVLQQPAAPNPMQTPPKPVASVVPKSSVVPEASVEPTAPAATASIVQPIEKDARTVEQRALDMLTE